MSMRTDAWVLSVGQPGEAKRATLMREDFDLGELGHDEALVAPLFGCWEGNMGHALDRVPVDICQLRGEEKVVLGNAGVVEVLQTGSHVRSVSPGQIAMVFGSAVCDRYGYPEKILAFDAPGTMGVLAKRAKMPGHCLIPLPPKTKYSPEQWAAFSVRYVTAWSNWTLSFGTLRLQLSRQELPSPHVWAWGGGTAFAQLELALHEGCHAVMLSGNNQRLEQIRRAGITPVDRREIGDLNFDERLFSTDLAWRRAYLQAEGKLLARVKELTGGEGVHMFVDHIGAAVFRATVKTLARQGIVTTAGWKAGQVVSILRAMECIERHQHLHTHAARYSEAVAAMQYAEERGWMPNLTGTRIWRFDEIPQLADSFASSDHELFPIFSVRD